MEKIFFAGWDSVFRTFIIAITAYAGVIVLLRISGKRTLSKMNAFDFIITIALGSTLSTVLLNKNVSLTDGMLAFALLIFLQFFITWSTVRWNFVKKLIKAEPSLLLYNGSFLKTAMRQERVTEDEILAAIRQTGLGEISNVYAAIIETDGSLSIIPKGKEATSSALQGVDMKGMHNKR